MNCTIGVFGNSKQETREGYNLFNKDTLTNILSSGGNINYIDNILTTPALNAYNWIKFTFPNIILSAGTYYFSFKIKLVSGTCEKVGKILFNNDMSGLTEMTLSLLSNSVSSNYQTIKAKIELSEALNVQNIFMQLPTNVSNAVLEITDVMLANKDAEYEPYGAMPSLDYPSEIKSCGDNVNLLNARYGIDITASDSYKIEVLAETEYTLSLTQKLIELGDKTAVQHQIRYYNENDENISSSGIMPFVFTSVGETQSGVRTITTPKNCKYVILDLGTYFGTGSSTIQNVQAKFEKGSVATSYSPYGQGCINEVVCNKNFFNKDNPQFLDGYGLNNTGFFARNDQRTYIIPITQNKKEISVSYTKILTGSRYYAFADEIPTGINSSHYGRIMFADSSYIGKITFTAINYNYKYLLLGSTKAEVFTDLQVEQSEGPTDHIAHEEQNYPIPTQQPMRSIGDTRDTFIKKDGKRYERHYISRYYFIGNESWTKNASFDNTFFTDRPQGMKANEIGLMSNITNWFGANYYSSKDCVMAVGSSFNIKNANISTVDDFKAWLTSQYNAGTPVYVDYVLAEPLDIECTEQQTQQLNALQKAKTYKNVTNIFSTDEVSAIIDVDYKKDLETIVNNMQQAILSQGGNV